MRKGFSRSIFILALAFLGGAIPASAASLQVYDSLGAIARRNGFADLATATQELKEYRMMLESCSTKEGYPSAASFGKFLDDFATTLHGYLQQTSIRRAYRQEVEAYVRTATSLGRQYLYEKARRFQGGAEKMDANDQELVRLSYVIHQRSARALRVPQSTSGAWNAAQIQALARNPRWANISRALAQVTKDDVHPCVVN